MEVNEQLSHITADLCQVIKSLNQWAKDNEGLCANGDEFINIACTSLNNALVDVLQIHNDILLRQTEELTRI